MVRKRTFHLEWSLILPVVLLILFGVVMVYSATALSTTGGNSMIIRHLAALFIGALGAAVLIYLPPKILDQLSPLFYAASIALLLLVLVAGDVHYGAKRWLSFGPIRFQPSEPAKLGMILYLGRYLARKRTDLSRFTSLAGALAIIGLPFLLVLKEPDLGTSLSFAAAGGGMLIWAGLPWLTLFAIGSPLAMALCSTSLFLWVPFLAGGITLFRRGGVSWLLIGFYTAAMIVIAVQTPKLWNSLEPYQQARVRTFMNPERDPAGAGYQVIQSKIAIGSGGATGQGYGRGSQKALAFLPRQHTDFIYSVVSEEFGFLGGIGVLTLFGIFLLRGTILARRVRSRFGSVVVIGVISMIFYHMAINVAMTLGLAPVTGLPLPFMSFGGSFIVTVLAAVGLLIGMAARKDEY
jgi:rod shape determining protein RodA